MEATVIGRLATKTREGEFINVLEREFEFSLKTAEAVVETAREVYDPIISGEDDGGKVERIVISKEARHGPPLRELRKVKVKLTLDGGVEDDKVRREFGNKGLRRVRILRMTEECLEEGGTLTQEDLADLLEVSVRTIQRDVKELREKGYIVTTRGVISDIGPSTSHKTKIIKLYLERKTYSEIKRITQHSTSAIKRYINNFSRSVFLHEKGLESKDIAFSIGISEKLVKEYIEIYDINIEDGEKDRVLELLSRGSRLNLGDKKKGGKNEYERFKGSI